MPRQARIDAPNALHHIIIRGIERKKIFQDDGDRDNFLNRLGEIVTESATSCYAWALMPNHAHLLLRTGAVPIATIMRRLLTGYAVTYNRCHRRHGQLFQNRYKSILSQEEAYFLELVRYIHLNPLRAGMVGNFRELAGFSYTGHSTIMGRRKRIWQDTDYVLGYFDRRVGAARRRYREYVKKGIEMGRRPELVGGGLIRSLGGWDKVKRMRKRRERLKGDERILGDSSFVLEVIEAFEEQFNRKYELKSKGYTLEKLAGRVSSLFEIEPEDIYTQGKYRSIVKARSLFCYWAVREIGFTATVLAEKLKLTQPAVSISVKRGERIAKENKFVLLET